VGIVLAPVPASASTDDSGTIEVVVEITPRPDCTTGCASLSDEDPLAATGSDPTPVLLTALSLGAAASLFLAMDRKGRVRARRAADPT
jgi:hypothetical protein